MCELEAPAEKVRGEIFNLTNGNYRISELALRVQHKLAELGMHCKIEPDYQYRNLRSCQASGRKLAERLGFAPKVTVEETVEDLAEKVHNGTFGDLGDPSNHNIRWLDLLEDANQKLGNAEPVLNLGPEKLKEVRSAALRQRSAVSCG